MYGVNIVYCLPLLTCHLKNCSKWIKMKKTCVSIILMMKYLIFQKRNHLHCLNSSTGLNRCIVYRDIWESGSYPHFYLGSKNGGKRQDFRHMVRKTYTFDKERKVLMKLVNMKKLDMKQWLCKHY